MSASTPVLNLLLQANRLKVTPRTGWAVRGVPRFESVADHSHGVALVALMLSDLVDEDLDVQKILAMATIHDLAESVTGDLSLGASRLLPDGAKDQMETAALDELLDGVAFADKWRGLWREFEDQTSAEAKLVRDADRVDLLTQALFYERTTGSVALEEFWQFAPVESFHYPASRDLIRQLMDRRPTASGDAK